LIEIKNILDLNEEQLNQAYKLFKKYNKLSSIRSIEEYENHCKSSHFNHGNDYYFLVKEGSIKGIAGLITKPVEETGEAYITNISVNENDKAYLDDLLKFIKNKTKSLPKHTLKAGFNIENNHIEEILLENGGTNSYEILEMIYKKNKLLDNIKIDDNISFKPLCKENEEDYIYAHNESFINSPNGSTIEKNDMEEFYKNYKKYPYYDISTAWHNENLIGFYEILRDDNIGEIESIGIIPEFQGKGFGLQILKHTVNQLKKQDLKEIKLIVVNTNEKAYQMYKKYGFELAKIYSKWYELKY
jgi:ribosomal protein S18 acetylase RimI-like enzyme